jgi:REP element-mobilizing transposase RayT
MNNHKPILPKSGALNNNKNTENKRNIKSSHLGKNINQQNRVPVNIKDNRQVVWDNIYHDVKQSSDNTFTTETTVISSKKNSHKLEKDLVKEFENLVVSIMQNVMKSNTYPDSIKLKVDATVIYPKGLKEIPNFKRYSTGFDVSASGEYREIYYNFLFQTKQSKELFRDDLKDRVETLISMSINNLSDLKLVDLIIYQDSILVSVKANTSHSANEIANHIKKFVHNSIKNDPDFKLKDWLWAKSIMLYTKKIPDEQMKLFRNYMETYLKESTPPKSLVMSDIDYNFVFVTRRNRSLFDNKRISKRLEEVIRETCKENEIQLKKIVIEPNYCYIYLKSNANLSPQKIMGFIKRKSASIITNEFPDIVKSTAVWSNSFLVTSKPLNLEAEIIEDYIKYHKERFS